MTIDLPTHCKWITTHNRIMLILSVGLIKGLTFNQILFCQAHFRVQGWGLVEYLTGVISSSNVAFEIFSYIQENHKVKLSKHKDALQLKAYRISVEL